MNRYKFSKATLRIKSDLLSKMIDSCVSCREMTRGEISSLSSVSEMTAGKLLSALDTCRFTNLTYKRNRDGGSPTKLHVFSDMLSTLIVDASQSGFSYSLINGVGECKLFEEHLFDSTVNFNENFRGFLSKTAAELTKRKAAVSAVGVILSEGASSDLFQNRDAISDFVASFFGISPSLCVTEADALAFAVKYKVNGLCDENKTAYIRISEQPFAACFFDGKTVSLPQIGNLMLSDSTTVSDMLENASGEKDMGRILARIVNFTYCAFSPGKIIIEHGNIRLGVQALTGIKRVFTLTNTPLPEISISKCAPGLAHFGLAQAVKADTIKKHIIGI